MLRQIEDAGAQLDRPRFGDQRREELERIGDRLRRGGIMFADEDLVIAELVEFDDARAILGEKRRKRLVGIEQGHPEEAELHPDISAFWVWSLDCTSMAAVAASRVRRDSSRSRPRTILQPLGLGKSQRRELEE